MTNITVKFLVNILQIWARCSSWCMMASFLFLLQFPRRECFQMSISRNRKKIRQFIFCWKKMEKREMLFAFCCCAANFCFVLGDHNEECPVPDLAKLCETECNNEMLDCLMDCDSDQGADNNNNNYNKMIIMII